MQTVLKKMTRFLVLGLLGGFFIVPLNALIQFNTEDAGLGRILAGSNFVQNLVMLAFLGLTVAAALLESGSVLIVTALGLVALVSTIVLVLGAGDSPAIELGSEVTYEDLLERKDDLLDMSAASVSAQLPVYGQLAMEPVAGEGVWIVTADGRRVLDLYGGHAVAALGQNR